MKIRIILTTLTLMFSVFSFAVDGRVVRVIDGDTLVILDSTNTQIKVRLTEIDAPERKQAFGTKSKEKLSNLCIGKLAALKNTSIDRYGRTLGRLYCNGIDANAEMIKSGFAWVYDRYVKDKGLYAHQKHAKLNKYGLWADSNPMKPWEYRQSKK